MGPKSDLFWHVFSFLLNFYILVGLVKMSFWMQNTVFYRLDLLSPFCKNALASIAGAIENRIENRSKIDEKSIEK